MKEAAVTRQADVAPNYPTLTEHPARAFSFARLRVGIIYGSLMGAAYAFVSRTIDVVALRDVPLYVDWPATILTIAVWLASGAVVGAVVALPRDGWKGVMLGAAFMVAIMFVKSALELPMAAMIFVFAPLFLPLLVLDLPAAAILRWLVNWHEKTEMEGGASRWRAQVGLMAAAVALAAFAGTWAQMPAHAREAVRKIDRLVQYALAAPPDKPLSVSLREIPNVRSRMSDTYYLTQHQAVTSPTAVEVEVYFDSGFVFSCLVDSEGATPLCAEGKGRFGGRFFAGDE